MSFLPKDYKVPASGGKYMKFQQGANKFRILSSAIVGEEVFTVEGKPARWRHGQPMPKVQFGTNKFTGQENRPVHFWAFVVWNYQTNAIEILEITQKGIMTSLLELTASEDWGDPKEYDVTVSRKGEGMETEYSTMPSPKKPLSSDIKKNYDDVKVNLEALFVGGDPFSEGKEPAEGESDLTIADIPF